jgi:DNA polymerase kappa
LPLRLAKDQTEINRIISEASKGSKFYEVGSLKSVGGAMMFMTLQNEKKKDKELTEKIAKILKQRDDVLKGVDIRRAVFCIGRPS